MDRRVFKTLILDWGCLFDGASNAKDVLEKLKNSRDRTCCDVILLHLELPGRGGEALAQEIKMIPWARGIVLDCIATSLAADSLGQDNIITRHTLTENRKQQVKILLVEAGRADDSIRRLVIESERVKVHVTAIKWSEV